MDLNYRMITIAREMRGLTQTQLSQIIPGLSQGALSKIEKNILGSSKDIIERIAKALDFPKNFFYDDYVFTPFNEIYYRKLVSAPVKKMTQLEAVIKVTMMMVDGLIDSVEIPEFKIPEFNVRDIGNVDKIARQTRYSLGIQDGCIDDLSAVLESNGIIIVEIDTDINKFSGLSVRTQGGANIIFINSSMPNDRKRFTLAHELGHIVMHIPFLTEIADRKTTENEADQFASEFMMPYKDFVRMVSPRLNYGELNTLKMYWKMSKQAIIHKAHRYMIIDDSRHKSLMIQLSMNGERKNETIVVKYPKPRLLQKMIDVHYEDLEYTEDELIQATNVPLNTLPLAINRKTNIFDITNGAKIRIQL